MAIDAVSLLQRCRVNLVTMTLTSTLPIIIRKDSAAGTCPRSMSRLSKDHRVSTNGPLDITVLGMCSGAALNGVSCALLRYNQGASDKPLGMTLLRLCVSR